METLKRLLERFWPTGVLFVIGFIVIIYIGFGFLYLQQVTQQGDLEEQVDKLSVVVTKPLPSADKLHAEYDKVNRSLSPMSVKTALDMLLSIAKESGIEVDPDADKFKIPPVRSPKKETVGGGSYQVLSFGNVRVQGDYESVMAFISDLDSGKTLENMVLTSLDIAETELKLKVGEGTRREEFRDVSFAVVDMMTDNGLEEIPVPLDYAGGIATNDMGSKLTTGFPNNTTTAIDKGYTGTGTPRNGYVLYRHDRISTDNTSQFETTSYLPRSTTDYYYTCETDGTVRQFDGPDVATAIEYPNSEWEARRTEMYNVSIAVMDMMTDNGLEEIPAPRDYAGGIAINDMGSKLTRGFPDNTTSVIGKGYTGTESPRNGYVLYKHDRISTDNTTLFDTLNYILTPTTKYYYTCEADGTVRQFDGPDVATAREYPNIELVAVLEVAIYSKALKVD